MNYRHAFHAGNFADLIKHAVLTELLAILTRAPAPLTVIDTHAGAGLYDLAGEAARRTGESAALSTLIEASDRPAVFARLLAAVERVNRSGERRYYPGSPILIGGALRTGDHYIACEIRPDDHAALKGVLKRQLGAEVLNADGWRVAAARVPAAPARLMVLIDPPFERGDDDEQAIQTAARILERNPGAVIAIWLPIKDLASFDAFGSRLEDAAARTPMLTVEVRLRPLADPMRLNGCAVAVINPPPDLAAPAAAAAQWIAGALGEAGAIGRATMYSPRPA
jgi:23S rRNA (adenine2030-N6)-methyltransferase